MDPQRLRALLEKLQTADPQDDALFHKIVDEALSLFGMMDKEFADAFRISRPTATRWRTGANAPHPAMRPVVYSWFGKRASALLRREEALLREQARVRMTSGRSESPAATAYPMTAAGRR